MMVIIMPESEMVAHAKKNQAAVPGHWADGDDDAEFKSKFVAMTAQQALAFRQANPPVSPWRVVGMQLILGLFVALVVWAITRKASIGWSAAYGALTVVIPAALFARGLTGRIASMNPLTAVMGFLVWEMVKVALTVAMLFAAPRLVGGLNWPIMLVSMVVAMQVYWLAFVFAPKKR